MPRQPRLDIPGLLHHVIVRGIERGIVFHDDADRHDFLDRFSRLLAESGMECFAWALIPNHFHLLLRPHHVALSQFMRRLLTGYAVNFNRRHVRSGHLFQNRYKSIVCEEDTYLLELIRYIHLNPIRAGLVSGLPALDHFRWCGHAELIGKRPSTGLAADGVLCLFGKRQRAARNAYRRFVADGLTMGKRPELVGGGLRRSLTSSSEVGDCKDYDDRILGSGEFVQQMRRKGLMDMPTSPRIDLKALQEIIEKHYRFTGQELCRRGRSNSIAEARAVFCYCGVRRLHYSGEAVGRHIGIGPSSVTRAARRGEEFIAADRKLRSAITRALKQ